MGFVQQQEKETSLGLENINIYAKTESSWSLTLLDDLLDLSLVFSFCTAAQALLQYTKQLFGGCPLFMGTFL